MMKKFISRISAVCLTAMLFTLAGCQDKDYYDPNYLPPSDGTPSTVDFSTVRNVKLDFNSVLPEGLITGFNVYATNPYKKVDGVWMKQDDIKPIAAGINVAGVSNLQRSLPMYVSELYVCPTTLFASTLMHAKIENNIARFNELMLVNDDSGVDTRSYATGAMDHYLSPKLSYSGGYYMPTVQMKKMIFPVAVKNAIAAAFPNSVKAESRFYQDASVKIEQEDEKDVGAELFLSVIHSDGNYNNSLMYFCYNGDKELSELTSTDKAGLRMISAFQFAKIGLNSTMQAGDYIQLKYYDEAKQEYVDRFPLGTKVGWVLSSNGFTRGEQDGNTNIWNALTRNRSTSYPWYFSVPSWNPETAVADKNHTIKFTATHDNKDYICFGFEDMRNDGSYKGDGDCNDVMFHIVSNPIKALDPPPYIPEEGTIETLENIKGILAFEDNWPRLGDYDINDVVVKYDSEITYVQKTLDGEPDGAVTVNRIIDRFSFINDGATFHNAFSYKVENSMDGIDNIKIDGGACTPVPDGDGFIIDLCSDVKMMTLPVTHNVVTTFKKGAVEQDAFNELAYVKAPYNPFIIPTNASINCQNGCIEVHLPFYPPTLRADYGLFRTYDDASDPGNGCYYAAPEGTYYPFALHLAEVDAFTIPVETKPISYTYPKYANWVSNVCGTVDADWYLYPITLP